jgi:hypothetical protein
MGGLHVALGIAHVNAFTARRRQALRRAAGAGDGACVRHRIAADHAGEARAQSQLREQGLGEPCRLVGDDPAFDARSASASSTSSMPGKSRVSRLRRCDKFPRNAAARRQRFGSLPGNRAFTTRAAPWLTAAAHRVVGQRRELSRGAAHSVRRPCRARCRARCRPDRTSTAVQAPCQAADA